MQVERGFCDLSLTLLDLRIEPFNPDPLEIFELEDVEDFIHLVVELLDSLRLEALDERPELLNFGVDFVPTILEVPTLGETAFDFLKFRLDVTEL